VPHQGRERQHIEPRPADIQRQRQQQGQEPLHQFWHAATQHLANTIDQREIRATNTVCRNPSRRSSMGKIVARMPVNNRIQRACQGSRAPERKGGTETVAAKAVVPGVGFVPDPVGDFHPFDADEASVRI
jgi:hypothetical protein